MRLALLSLTYLLLTSCGSSPFASQPVPLSDVSGKWVHGAQGYSLIVNLSQNDTTLTGEANVCNSFDCVSGPVSGTYKRHIVALTLGNFFGYGTFTGSAFANPREIVGAMNGASWTFTGQ